MPHLLVIDITLGVVAILVATWIVLRGWWSTRPSKGHAEVAGLAGEGSALGETVVPGFSEGAMDPDPGARWPDPGGRQPDPGLPERDSDEYPTDPGLGELTGLEQGPPQVSRVADVGSGADDPEAGADDPEAGADDPEPGGHDPEPGAHNPARPEQAPSLGNGVAGTRPDSHAPAAEPGGQPYADGTGASSGRVYSYYEGADQQMADYLAELGWSEESGARDLG